MISIRPAVADDAQLILDFIIELAIYEKAPHEVLTDVAGIRESLFGEDARASALICTMAGQPVGYAVYFYSYSTWLGKNGIYLEDVYVSPAHRGKGAGKAMLKYLAGMAVAQKCGRLEWSVLDWNTPAIEFYQALGAKPQSEWIKYRLAGTALEKLANS
jgi:GNAT superfamily N-acetyltransferase